MYKLYGINTQTQISDIIHPGKRLLMSNLSKNLSTTVSYYSSRAFRIDSNHILSRLMYAINAPLSIDVDRYADYVAAQTDRLARVFSMTSSVSAGSVHPGHFFGNDVREVILLVNGPWKDWEKEWMNLTPVEVISHPYSTLGMLPANGMSHGSEFGYAVIKIDPVALMILYRKFRQLQSQEDSQLNRGNFISMMVLPRMLQSITDHAIMNLAARFALGAPLGAATKKHPFALVDVQTEACRILPWYNDQYRKYAYSVMAPLMTLPTCTPKRYAARMLYPPMASTMQVYWALVLGSLNVMNYTLGVCQRVDSTMLTRMRRVLKTVRNQGVMKSRGFDSELYEIEERVAAFNGSGVKT